MSEQSANPRDLEREIILRALKDPAFRAKLLAEPKETVEGIAGSKLPEGTRVKIIEQEPNTVYLMLPEIPTGLNVGSELSETDLMNIAAAGPKPSAFTCNTGCIP